MYENVSDNIGFGIDSPRVKFHIFDNINSFRVLFDSDKIATNLISNSMPALELSVETMNDTHYKYGYGIKFMSSDPSFTSHENKWLAGIIPEATESYDSEQDGGMAIGFYTTPNDGGFGFPWLRLKIGSDGSISADGIRTYTSDSYFNNLEEGDTETNGMCSIGASCQGNTISGGGNCTIDVNTSFATVGGGYKNTIFSTNDYGTIGGGYYNIIWDYYYSTISGGKNNVTYGSYSTIGGGYSNYTESTYSTIGGGYSNAARGSGATVAGGYNNDAIAQRATIGGGYYNEATGGYSTVGGGTNNEASGYVSTIPGGTQNTASGDLSFAAGNNATAQHYGSSVWNDHVNSCSSDVDGQFKICACGGAWFETTVSADGYILRSPYPENLDVAYSAVFSLQRLPEGQYDPKDRSKQLDHSLLSDYVKYTEPDGEPALDMSATVVAQNEVIKHLVERTTSLEQRLAILEALLSSRR